MAATLQSIYDRLHGADPYHPYSATTFQDWATEAGDILTINRGEDGYVVPVHSAHLSWRGSPQVVLNGTGNKKRESVEKAAQRKYARGGSGYRTSQVLFREFTDEDGLLRSSLMMTASELRTEFQASNSAVYSVISQTASEIRTEVGNAESGIYSSISETADQIMSEVNAANSTVYSVIRQTSSQILSEVANVNSNIRSVINQTASSILLEVGKSAHVYHQYGDPASTEDVKDKDIWIKDAGVQNHGKAATFTHGQLGSFKLADFYGSEIYVRENGSWVRVGGDQLQEYNYAQIKVEQDRIAIITDGMSGDYAEFVVELGRIRSRVDDVETGLSSAIEQTASMIRTAVWTANSEMYSEILQTQSMIRSEVANSESGIRSTITQTASGLQIQISRKRAVYLQPTDPSLTNTMYNGDIWIVDNNIYSHAAMAMLTHATLGTYSLYDYMGKMSWVWKGGQWIPFYDERAKTKDEALIDINDKHIMTLYGDVNDKYSMFLQEKTQIRSIVEDKTNKLGSEILQTASEIRTSVWSANSQIYSTISQTASQIRTEVTNKISSVESSITQTASQIRTEVTNKVSSLQSQITQSADKISLVVQGTGANAKIKSAEIWAGIDTHLRQSHVKIAADLITLDGDRVENNTLILTNLEGEEIPFSKATTLTPSWSGSTLTVTATQTNGGSTTTVGSKTVGFGGSYGSHDIELGLTQNGYPSRNSSTQISVPIKVVQQQGGGSTTDRYTVNLNYSISSLLQEKSVSSDGDVTPDSGYIGLSKVTVSGVHSTRFTLSCTEKTQAYPGSSIYNYTFTLQSAYSFSKGSNYYFYR